MKGVARSRQLASERRHKILRYLHDHGSASITTICELVAASPATVHRDLEMLADKGLLSRVRGGALSIEGDDDPPVALERGKRVGEKQAIADAAVGMIGPDVNSVFLEASTTVSAMVPALRGMEDKVFVTNSPEIALELVKGRAEVILIGGELRPRTLATVGPLTVAALELVSIDMAFIGVSAVDIEGLSSVNLFEAETKSAILNASTRSIALGDGDKLGKRALAAVGPLSSIDGLITDAGAPAEQVALLRGAGLEVTLAD
jgi:DeoR family transcriptional regulator, aga operon transcriptional repressor